MTEKQYVRIVDHTEKEVQIFDTINEKKIFNIFFNELDSAICLNGALTDVVDLLNSLNNENEQLKTTIQQLRTDNTKQKKLLNTTMKENEHIKQTIKDMIESERTELGKMVLRQLWRQIQ